MPAWPPADPVTEGLLEARIRALSPEKQELLERLTDAGASPQVVSPRKPWSPVAPVTAQQRRMWQQQQADPASTFANVQFALKLSGPVNLAALVASLEEIARRHESLRVTFREEDDRLVQVVGEAPPDIRVIDLRALHEETRELRLGEHRQEASRPFDLRVEPPLRARIVRLGDVECAFFLTIHHIVLDGWSANVLVRELNTLYTARLSGRTERLALPAIQLPDYAAWQQDWLRSPERVEHSAYWRRRLAGAPPFLELEGRAVGVDQRRFERKHLPFELEGDVVAGLRAVAAQERSTLFMALVATLSLLLSRRGRTPEVVIGVPIAGRFQKQLEDSLGLYTNAVALRIRLEPHRSFRELLRDVRRTAEEAYSWLRLPIEEVISELRPELPPDRAPLFQTMFTVYNYPAESSVLPDLEVVDIRDSPSNALEVYSPSLSPIDICIGFRDHPHVTRRCSAFLEYNRRVIDDELAAGLAADWTHLIERVVAQPDHRLRKYET